MTHFLAGKYYPNIKTQFIIGCTCYILIFIMMMDFYINNQILTDFKYYILFLISVDISFVAYKTKTNIKYKNKVIIRNIKPNQIEKLNSPSIDTITLSSEMNDLKIIHDLNSDMSHILSGSIFENQIDNLIANTCDDKSDDESDDESDVTSNKMLN